MTQLIFDRDEELATWAETQYPDCAPLARPLTSIGIASSEGEIIGVAIFYEKYSTWKGRCTYLEDLIVTESKRGVGAGKALFEGVINYAKERNSGRMEWQVLDWNQPAIDFYKSYNAELDGTWYNGRFTKEQLQNINL